MRRRAASLRWRKKEGNGRRKRASKSVGSAPSAPSRHGNNARKYPFRAFSAAHADEGLQVTPPAFGPKLSRYAPFAGMTPSIRRVSRIYFSGGVQAEIEPAPHNRSAARSLQIAAEEGTGGVGAPERGRPERASHPGTMRKSPPSNIVPSGHSDIGSAHALVCFFGPKACQYAPFMVMSFVRRCCYLVPSGLTTSCRSLTRAAWSFSAGSLRLTTPGM